jgi:WD40 repeat protein
MLARMHMRWSKTGPPLLTKGVVFCLASAILVSARGQEPERPRIRSVAFSPDGKWLTCGTGEPKGGPGTVTVWNAATRRPLWTHRENAGVPAVAFSPDGLSLAAASYNGAVPILDVATGTVKATLRHPKEARSVAFSPDGRLLATACWDGLIRVWDVQRGIEKLHCKGHKDQILAVAYSADGNLLLSAGGSDGAKLWDAATGAEKHTWKHGQFYVSCAGFSPDGEWAMTGGYDGTARLWDVATGELRARFSGTGGVNSMAFSSIAQTLAICSNSREIALFPLCSQGPTAKQSASINSLLIKLDNDSYEVRESASKELLDLGFAAEPELRLAAKDSPSAEVRIRARRVREDMLGKPVKLLRGHTDEVDAVFFSPDGSVLASGSKDGTVRLWEVAAGKELVKLVPPK